jgi:hypothetical protein
MLSILRDIVRIKKYSDFNLLNKFSAFNLGFFTGAHIILFFGLVFLIVAYRIQRKIRIKNSEVDQSIENIGHTQSSSN